MMQTTRFPVRSSSIAERVSDFMSHLRDNGLAVGIGETNAALRAFTSMDVVDVNSARMALKAICAQNEDGFARFDDLFKAFWLNRGRERASTTHRDRIANNTSQRSNLVSQEIDGSRGASGLHTEVDAGQDADADTGGKGRLVASETSNLEKTDFRELMTPQSLAEAEQVARTIAQRIRDRRSRRRRADKRGSLIDLRRVARAAVQTDGEPIRLFKRKKPDRPMRIVALLDVSGSMTVYARVFLAFLKGLMSADQKTEAFLFHTKLVNIGEALRDHDTLRAVNRLTMMAQGFGGGTKIAGNLASFNAQYARRIVNGRTVVVILSDGYDTDPPEQMMQQMQRLKRRGCKIIWLNPLSGWKDYAPVAQGMAAALPFVDLFAAANTLESLEAIAPHLETL